jgi:hypothetical protein
MHTWFSLIADTLNEAGLDQRIVLQAYKLDVPWSAEVIKETMWRRVQTAMYGKRSTTKLTTDEVTKIYDVINKFLGDNFKVHIPFPSVSSAT